MVPAITREVMVWHEKCPGAGLSVPPGAGASEIGVDAPVHTTANVYAPLEAPARILGTRTARA
jgi:hypothetical protein